MTASDATGVGVSGQAVVQVVPSPTTNIAFFVNPPTTVQAGIDLTYYVTGLDAYGNVAPDCGCAMSISSTDPKQWSGGGSLYQPPNPGNFIVGGPGNFSLYTLGSQQITISGLDHSGNPLTNTLHWTHTVVAPPNGSPGVVVGPATGKLLPTATLLPSGVSATLSGAVNEFVDFELVISGGLNGLDGISIQQVPYQLRSLHGQLPLWLYREAYYHVGIPSSSDGSAGDVPDALIPLIDPYYNESRAGPDPFYYWGNQGSMGFYNFWPRDPRDTSCGTNCASIPPQENRVVYGETYINQYEPFGDVLTGSVRVHWKSFHGQTTGEGSVVIPITLTVRSFSLPSDTSLRTMTHVTQSALCAGHFSNQQFTLVSGVDDLTACNNNSVAPHYPQGISTSLAKMYARLLIDHRLSASFALPPSYSSPTDWSAFDTAYGSTFDGTPDPGLPSPYNAYPNGIAAFADGNGNFASLRGGRETAIPYSWPHATSGQPGSISDAEDQDRHKQWWDHFVNKVWWSRTFDDFCDEPHLAGAPCPPTPWQQTGATAWNTVHERAQNAHFSYPAFPTFLTTSIGDLVGGYSGTGYAAAYATDVNYLAPLVNFMYDKNPDMSGLSWPTAGTYAFDNRPDYSGFLGSIGGSPHLLWWYQSCASDGCGGTKPYAGGSYAHSYYSGFPSYMVDVKSAAQHRLQEWLSFRYSIGGEHYYEAAADLPTGWYRNADGQNVAMPTADGNGDGTLVYAGTPSTFPYKDSNNQIFTRGIAIGGVHHIALPSLRLKMIRDGLQDYEYLVQAAAKNLGFAQGQVDSLMGVTSTSPPTDCTAMSSKGPNVACPPTYSTASVTIDQLLSARKALGDYIETH